MKKLTTSLAILGLWLVSLTLVGGCEINKPEMPTYDTSVNIPLGVERIEIMDLVDDEEFLVVSGDSSLGFFIDGDPDTLAFDFELSADIGGQSVEHGLGNFNLPDADPMAYSFQLGDIWPPAAGMSGVSGIVPAFPINVASSGQEIPDIESAILASGTAAISVTNGLPVPVSAPSGPDQVILELVNPENDVVFATFTFPAIPAGGTNTQTADLAGATLPGTIAVRLQGGSRGSAGAPVTVNGSDALDIAAIFSDLVVSEADAVVESQTFHSSFATELPADYEITSATISSGSVGLALTNGLPVPCTAVLTWAELQNLEGQPLTSTFDLAPGQALSRTIDFADRLLVSGGSPLTALTAQVDIATPGSEGAPVAMSAGDGLTADISGGSIAFSSVTGIVPAYDVELDPIEEEIDLPDELDGISFTSTTMVLRMTNSSGLPGDLDLTLTGTSASGQVRSLDVQQTILPAMDRAPVVTPIVLNESNSQILDFLNNLPETITLTGQIQVGGDGATGTVRSTDFAAVSWELSAPLEVIIHGSEINSDPSEVSLDEDVRDMIGDHSLGAYIQTEILNHLPIGVELRILAGTDSTTVETAPLLVIGPLEVLAAATDPVTHTVSEAVISRPVVELTEEQARIFALPDLFTMISVTLPSTEGEPVRMMSTDFLEVRGLVRVDVHVNDEW
jgi:hypothetical protein|nr:hypothetical protein [Candidatus Krumholzibacteria bacterium]